MSDSDSGFKSWRAEAGQYTAGAQNQTCLENRDPLGDSICGRVNLRVTNRSRGFSARSHKRCPLSGVATDLATVFGRRVTDTHTNGNHTGGVAHV